MPALLELRGQGVVKGVGVGMNRWQPLARAVRETDVDLVMLAGRYTLLDQPAEVGLPGLQRGAAAQHSVGTFGVVPARPDREPGGEVFDPYRLDLLCGSLSS